MTTAESPSDTRDDTGDRRRVTAETMSLRQFLRVADRYHVYARDLQYSERDCEMLEAVQQVTNLAAPRGPREAAIARLADEWNRLYVDSTPPAPPPAIFPGDVVRHQDTGRIAVIVQTGRTWPDGTMEHHVRVVSPIDEERPLTYWSAANIQRYPCRDPYRAYLALVASEEDPAHIARRLLHGRHARRFGPHLSEGVWDRAYWRLCNGKRRLPTGETVSYDLGRSHWDRAANDCLDRRDRAARFWYTRGEWTLAERCGRADGKIDAGLGRPSAPSSSFERHVATGRLVAVDRPAYERRYQVSYRARRAQHDALFDPSGKS